MHLVPLLNFYFYPKLSEQEWVLLQIDTDSTIMKADEPTVIFSALESQNNDAVSQMLDLSQERWTDVTQRGKKKGENRRSKQSRREQEDRNR